LAVDSPYHHLQLTPRACFLSSSFPKFLYNRISRKEAKLADTCIQR
jgi:hypothetical protein